MIIILFLLFIHLFFGLLIENVRTRTISFCINLSLLLVIMFFTLGITYTADWLMYLWIFEKGDDNTDVVFFQLSKIFNSLNLEYESLFIFHILASLIIYWFLISRYTRNYFYVFMIYIVLDYVHFVNQLRYYLGFPIMMTGFYFLLYQKKYSIAILLIILGILSHKALAVLLIFIPFFYFIPQQKFLSTISLTSLGVILIVYLFTKGGMSLVLQHYDAYFGKEYNSTFLGGVFNALPYTIYYVFLLFQTPFLLKKKNINDFKLHEFLYKISFFSIIFLPASFLLQILGHRYILPFSIFWVIFYLYLIKDLSEKERLFKMLLFTCIHLLAIVSIYILPDFVLSNNHFLEEMEFIIKSIPYLKNLIF